MVDGSKYADAAVTTESLAGKDFPFSGKSIGLGVEILSTCANVYCGKNICAEKISNATANAARKRFIVF